MTCRCPSGHSGDGFTCQPIDPCVSGVNGGCSLHATCTMTAPVRPACDSPVQVCATCCLCVRRVNDAACAGEEDVQLQG